MAVQPTTGHSANFRGATEDGRLENQTFERNSKPVIDGLVSFLGDLSGNALEIGSGTGQHICAFATALPQFQWTPSEPDAIHRHSIDAWRQKLQSVACPAIALDAAADWASQPEIKKISPLGLIISMNVIHIAPFSVAQGMIQGARKTLKPGGFLAVYGPFSENGMHTGDGNRMFDERLRADNPEWGVRDVDELLVYAVDAGLAFDRLMVMPANNRLLIFRQVS